MARFESEGHRTLHDSTEVVCEACLSRLPPDYTLTIHLSRYGASHELCDGDGNEIEFDCEYRVPMIESAIRAALDHDAEQSE